MSKKLFFLSSAALFALDRLVKYLWADAQRTLIPGVIALHGTRNTGMAFGLFAGRTLPLILVSVLLLAGLIWYVKTHAQSRTEQFGLGLMVGGALGNLFDRIVYGHVIDMLELLFFDFFIFNVADIGVTVGAVLLGVAILFGKDTTQDGTA